MHALCITAYYLHSLITSYLAYGICIFYNTTPPNEVPMNHHQVQGTKSTRGDLDDIDGYIGTVDI